MKARISRIKGRLSWRDAVLTVLIMAGAVALCMLIRMLDDGDIYVSMVFLLAVLLVARVTDGYLYGIVASVVGVFAVNYVFTYPYFAFNFTISGYPLTFLSMLVVSVVTSAMTTQVKGQEKVRRAAERERIRGNLLRAISHDLRTPLTSIMGASSVILESDARIDDAQRHALVSEIREDAEWLLRMVENILSITRIDDSIKRIVKVREPVEEVVGAAVDKFHKRHPAQAVDVRVPDELLMVPMDPMLIEQVLMNLLENALRHGKTTTRISLDVAREGDAACFMVRDDGCGLPADAMEHLFEGYVGRMERDDTDAARGMGIGLSVCMSIIKAHDGHMTGENCEGGGALFKFTLPLSEDTDEQQQAADFDRRG